MAQIKKDTSLRKAILQAAITGQLISDVKGTTETGKQLLDRIIAERNEKALAEWKESLKKNPKAKKPSPIIASLQYDQDGRLLSEVEVPFEIPENWCWCRLGDIICNVQYGTASKSKETGKVPVLRMGNIQNGKIDYEKLVYTDDDFEIGKYKLEYNDLLFNRTNSREWVGKVGIYKAERQAIYAGYLVRLTPIIISSDYLNYVCQTSYYWKYCQSVRSDAIQQSNINAEKLKKFLIPLPPLAVQNAIVAKLEQVLPLVDAYENAVLQKEELKNALPDKVKKAILQEAITGKLTETWRKTANITENGKQLLDRIITERNEKALAEWEEALKKNPKAKKPVSVVASEIEEDEIPFEVPDSWCWCRLGALVPFGQCENAEPNEIEDDAWILDLEDIEKDSGIILQFKTKKEVDSKSTKHIFKKGYVLYSKLRPYLNKCVIAPKDGYCTSEILPLNFSSLVNNKYAQTFLMSPYFVDYTDSLSFGVKMPRLGTEDGKKALVPLPPLEEQEEIVKKVEELLPLCK